MRSNVDDIVMVTSVITRGITIGALGYAIFKLASGIVDEVRYELDWKYPG